MVMRRQPIYEDTERVASIPAYPWLGLRDTEIRSVESTGSVSEKPLRKHLTVVG